MKGIAIDGNVPRGEAAAINFSEFYDSLRQRYARFYRGRGRVVRSSARSFGSLVRSLARGEEDGRWDLATQADAVLLSPATANRYALSLSLSSLPSPHLVFLFLRGRAFRPHFRFSHARPFFPSSILLRTRARPSVAARAPLTRQRFYLIALLCFIEQLLRSRAFCFFFLRSLPETAVPVIPGFNTVRALPGHGFPTPFFLYAAVVAVLARSAWYRRIFMRRIFASRPEEVNIPKNSSMRDDYAGSRWIIRMVLYGSANIREDTIEKFRLGIGTQIAGNSP